MSVLPFRTRDESSFDSLETDLPLDMEEQVIAQVVQGWGKGGILTAEWEVPGREIRAIRLEAKVREKEARV